MEEINIKTLLPVGEKLKPLLSKSCISESDLKGILAERGVFMGDNSKQMSIRDCEKKSVNKILL